MFLNWGLEIGMGSSWRNVNYSFKFSQSKNELKQVKSSNDLNTKKAPEVSTKVIYTKVEWVGMCYSSLYAWCG